MVPRKLATYPSIERLHALFSYDQDSGVIAWRIWTRREAGTVSTKGYRLIYINNRQYLAHIIIWALVTGSYPNHEIDHRNLNRSDNRWANLRPATRSQQSANRPKPINNTSGYKGVAAYNGRWIARITVDKRHRTLGIFDTPQAAHAAYCVAAREAFGEFARDG